MIKYKIVSDSMMPLIPIGAEIIIEKTNESSTYKKFDILLFKIEDKLFCHYFWHQNVNIDSDFITTRALKDFSKDVPFQKKFIIGKIINYKISTFLKVKIFFWDLIN